MSALIIDDVVVGYDDAHHSMRLLNSWGAGWGDGGYTWIDYDFCPTVVSEAYIAKDPYGRPARGVVTVPGRASSVLSSTPCTGGWGGVLRAASRQGSRENLNGLILWGPVQC